MTVATPGRAARSVAGNIPLVGGAIRQLEEQTAAIGKLIEDQARLVAALPTTLRLANDSLVAFASTVQRLDTLVRRLDNLTRPLEEPLTALAPRLERLVPILDMPALQDVPEMLDAVRREGLPALAAVADTQRQVAVIAASVERLMEGIDDTLRRVSELPGANLIGRRLNRTAAKKVPPPA
jgi:ABC-type transporter Mla subunit MlaD